MICLMRMLAHSKLTATLVLGVIVIVQTMGSSAQNANELGSFELEYAYDVELPNPALPSQGISLYWQIELIPVTPNSKAMPAREAAPGQDIYIDRLHGMFESGSHVIVVLEGTIDIDSPQGSGRFSQGQGTVFLENGDRSSLDSQQYFISNPTSDCAVMMRVSVIGVGGMAGPGRASKEVPNLSTSCGDKVVAFQGGARNIETDTIKVAIAEIWSDYQFDETRSTRMLLNHDTAILVEQGTATLSLVDCADCPKLVAQIHPPTTIMLSAGQSFDLVPSRIADTRILMLAIHSPADDPQLYFSS